VQVAPARCPNCALQRALFAIIIRTIVVHKTKQAGVEGFDMTLFKTGLLIPAEGWKKF